MVPMGLYEILILAVLFFFLVGAALAVALFVLLVVKWLVLEKNRDQPPGK
jgi:hypothetical protein